MLSESGREEKINSLVRRILQNHNTHETVYRSSLQFQGANVQLCRFIAKFIYKKIVKTAQSCKNMHYFELVRSASGVDMSVSATFPLLARTILENKEISLSNRKRKKSFVQEV